MSDWIKDKKTGLVYRPIYKKVYPVIAYDSGYGNPAIFKVGALGEVVFDEGNKLNDNKSVYRKWKKILALTAEEVDKKRLTYFPFNELKEDTIPDYLRDDAFEIYVEPTIKDFVKPNTLETFKDII